MKKSSGLRNKERGDEIEKYIAEKYGGSKYDKDGFDVELENYILEVKACLSYHVGNTNGRLSRHTGRILIGMEDHDDFLKEAQKLGKTPVYVVVNIPRKDNGEEDKSPENWREVWISYNNMETMIQNPEIGRPCSSNWKGRKDERFFYRISLNHLF